jgi:hypothetical protein
MRYVDDKTGHQECKRRYMEIFSASMTDYRTVANAR